MSLWQVQKTMNLALVKLVPLPWASFHKPLCRYKIYLACLCISHTHLPHTSFLTLTIPSSMAIAILTPPSMSVIFSSTHHIHLPMRNIPIYVLAPHQRTLRFHIFSYNFHHIKNSGNSLVLFQISHLL